jgi:hypothetical protein
MKYSVIILLEERHEDFHNFIRSLDEVFSVTGEPFEMLIVANGLGAFLRNKLDEIFGSYQQITNKSLVKAIKSLDNGTDIISPWRQKRVDPAFNKLQSKIFNSIVRILLKTELHDLSITVKIFNRRVLEETVIYGNMYRFLPIIASKRGFKTKEVPCEHFQERGKTGFYSLNEYIVRIIDIITIYFNLRFVKKPLRFFSSIGLFFLLLGSLFSSYIFIERIFYDHLLGDRPIMIFGILLMVLGVQVASVGLLGEIIVFIHARKKKDYTIERII